MKKQIIKLNDVRTSNNQSVLELILSSDTPLSRTEIAAKLGCDNTTVSRACAELLNRGILCCGAKQELPHGRPRTALRLAENGPLLLGIAWEPERISGVLTDLRGEEISKHEKAFPYPPDTKTFLDAASDVTRILQDQAGKRLCGIGVAVFGNYTGVDFVIENAAALPALNGVGIVPFLNRITAFPATVGDHLVAEMHFFQQQKPELTSGTLLLVSAGNGIGMVISENGSLPFSKHNHGGELGHSIAIPGGLPCRCGRRGCLETVASIPAIMRELKIKENTLEAVENIGKRFDSGDQAVTTVVQKCAEYLGTAIADQLNNLPVDKLILTGELLYLGDKFAGSLEKNILDNCFSSVREGLTTEILPPKSENILPRGAALMARRDALAKLFANKQ